MKWIIDKDDSKIVNLDNVLAITKALEGGEHIIKFFDSNGNCGKYVYDSVEQRDNSFKKIKKLLKKIEEV